MTTILLGSFFKLPRPGATPQTSQKSLSGNKIQALLALGGLWVIRTSRQGRKSPAEMRKLEFWKSARKWFPGLLFLKEQPVPGTDKHIWTLARTHGRGKVRPRKKSPDWESDGWVDCCPRKEKAGRWGKCLVFPVYYLSRLQRNLCYSERTPYNYTIVSLMQAPKCHWGRELRIMGYEYMTTHAKTTTFGYSQMNNSENLGQRYMISLKWPWTSPPGFCP